MPRIDDEKRAKRREIILKAAMECFSAKGYTKTKMDDIVEASGVSKGGIYLYFKSKDEVFRAIADEVLERRKAILDNFDGSMTYTQKLKKYLENIVSNYNKPEYKKRIRFSYEFWIENKDKEYLGEVSKKQYLDLRMKKSVEDISIIIQGGIASGEFREDIDLKSLFYIFFATIDGMAFYSGVLDKPIPKNGNKVLGEIFEKFVVR